MLAAILLIVLLPSPAAPATPKGRPSFKVDGVEMMKWSEYKGAYELEVPMGSRYANDYPYVDNFFMPNK